MTNNSCSNIKSFIISVLSKRADLKTLKECRENFLINAFICFSSIKGKINFLPMERFANGTFYKQMRTVFLNLFDSCVALYCQFD